MANDLINTLRGGFITCNCPGDGSGYVKIRFTQIRDAQELHRLIAATLTEESQPSALVNEVAERIAKAVSMAWPNGYSHRDHFPQAVAIIADILADFKRAIELNARGKIATEPELAKLIEEAHELTAAATPRPWHWQIEDYSQISLEGPEHEAQHVFSHSPCRSCLDSAKNKNETEWQFGRCTTIGEPDATLLSFCGQPSRTVDRRS